ncbi:uncharacterized protein LOC111103028 isoform X5 [Crassostrea virginica]
MKTKGLFFVLLAWGSFFKVTENESCPWSSQTEKTVQSCPTTKEELEKQKARKNCEALKKQQNCTEPEKFQYHCVINELENSLVEVCAPEYIINGDKDCYTVVKHMLQISNTSHEKFITDLPSITTDTSISAKPASGQTKEYVIVVAVFVGVFVIAVIVIILILIFRRRRTEEQEPLQMDACNTVNEEQELLQEDECNTDTAVKENSLDPTKTNSDNENEKQKLLHSDECDTGNTDTAVLEFSVDPNKTNSDNDTAVQDISLHPMKTSSANELTTSMEYFVETRFAKECLKILEERGMVVLIGEQGCGKTSIADHIMNTGKYKEWTKRDIQDENIDTLKPEAKTFLYIDDLFDGYLYEKELYEWWNSLFRFHSRFLENKDLARLIITVKDTVMKKAGVFIEVSKRNETFFLKADSDENQLSMDEKLNILGRQCEYAKWKRKLDKSFIRKKLENELNVAKCSIGFPLCANMYAFEEDNSERDSAIFDHTRKYVRESIKRKIESDKANDVKTLFLLLLFYLHPIDSHPNESLDSYLKDGKRCQEFLQSFSSDKMLDKMNLSYENLYQTAHELEGSFLIKHKKLYKFKHRIYLEGVCDYFFLKYFDFIVDYIPFDVLRICKLYDVSTADLKILRDRLKKNLSEGAFFKVLECDVLKDTTFEKSFCDDLQEKCFLESKMLCSDATSVFKFPMIFWASMYNLKTLERTLLELAEKDKDNERLQGYLAMFGKCCGDDENYITCVTCPPEIEQTQKAVFKYKNSKGKRIQHLLSESNLSDHPLILRLLK